MTEITSSASIRFITTPKSMSEDTYQFYPSFDPKNDGVREVIEKASGIDYESYLKRLDAQGISKERQNAYLAKIARKTEACRNGCNSDRNNENIYLFIEIPLEDAASGPVKKIAYERKRICKDCRGTGVISGTHCKKCNGSGFRFKRTRVSKKIVPGVTTGVDHRSEGKGHEISEDIFGNLYQIWIIPPHPVFRRENPKDSNDLTRDVFISEETARTGGIVKTTAIDGEPVWIEISAGTADGTKICIPERGIRWAGTTIVGNLYAQIRISKDKENAVSRQIAAPRPKILPPRIPVRTIPKTQDKNGETSSVNTSRAPQKSPDFDKAYEAAARGTSPSRERFPSLDFSELTFLTLLAESVRNKKQPDVPATPPTGANPMPRSKPSAMEIGENAGDFAKSPLEKRSLWKRAWDAVKFFWKNY